jgi:Flp pilus assembly protein TadG
MRNRRNQRGAALLATGLALIVIVPAIGLGIDAATLYAVRLRLSQGVDAAVLAGARSLSSGASVNSQQANATAMATKYFYANFPTGFFGTTNCALSVSVTQNDATRVRSVAITATVNAPLYFMGILSQQSPPVQISGTATRRDVNVMLVLDRSGSMVSGNAIGPLQTAATAFVDEFASGRDNVGLITFGGGTFLAYPPSVNFKSDSPSVQTLIGQVVGGGATNTAQALWLAYQQLVALNEPGALNAIVLFTDGRPTAFTADFRPLLTPASTCTSLASSKLGFLTYTVDQNQNPVAPYGIVKAFNSSITDVSDSTPAPNGSGCAYAQSPTRSFANVALDFTAIPALDYWGNSTNDGYQPVNLSAIGDPAQIGAASTNAADSAASRIRADTQFQPIILTIGLGGNPGYPPDQTFMQRISNDPGSAFYTTTEPAGLYVFSPSTAQLQGAFLRIASEILRLAQ